MVFWSMVWGPKVLVRPGLGLEAVVRLGTGLVLVKLGTGLVLVSPGLGLEVRVSLGFGVCLAMC